jgi:hypothetical protein
LLVQLVQVKMVTTQAVVAGLLMAQELALLVDFQVKAVAVKVLATSQLLQTTT